MILAAHPDDTVGKAVESSLPLPMCRSGVIEIDILITESQGPWVVEETTSGWAGVLMSCWIALAEILAYAIDDRCPFHDLGDWVRCFALASNVYVTL